MVGEQIKKLLKTNQMNQVDLAQKINISESKMSKILNGSLEPNLTDLNLISKVLNVTIDELVNGESIQNMTLIEKAIIEGYESFTKLLNNDYDWIYRTDERGYDIFYYLKKHDSYDYLIYFYENKHNNVLSVVQKYYAQMIHTLIEKKLYEKYLEIDSFKFRWDLSEIDTQEKFNLNNIDSDFVIYEVINNPNEKSTFYKKEYENKIGKIELQQYTIYIYLKKEFRIICDELLMSQNADPKFIINAEKRKDYIKKYYANNKEILNKKIELIKTTNIYDDVENVNEALFLTGDNSSIIELATFQINRFKKVDFKNLQETNNESNYLGKIAQFNKKVERIKHYLILCIKYNNIGLFKNIISIPKLEDIIMNVKEERTNFTDYGINKIRNKFFNFEMPFSFKKEVLEAYPNLMDEIEFDYQEIIKSEKLADYKYAIDKLDIYYYKLPFYADLNIKEKLKRELTKSDYKNLIDAIHFIILEHNLNYLKTGKLDYDAIYTSLLNKSLKNFALKYLLVKIWINVGKLTDISNKEIYLLFDEGIEGVEKIKSIKEEAINYIFNYFSTYVDNLFVKEKLYSLLPSIKNINFFKMIVSKFNPNILGKVIKESNLEFADIEKIKVLYNDYTNQLSNSDLAILYRNTE